MFCSFKFTKSVCCDVYLFSDWSGCGRIRHSKAVTAVQADKELEQEYNCLSLCIMAF